MFQYDLNYRIMKGKIVKCFKSLINITGISEVTEPMKKQEQLSNQKLLDDLLILFKDTLEKESVRTTMLFPMYFEILMHPADYKDRKDALAVILPEFISAFKSVIDENKKRFPNVKNVSTKWVFQFSPCRVDGELTLEDGRIIKVERGKLIKSARLFYNEEKGANVQVQSNIKVSVKCDNSDVMNIAYLNFEALKSVDILEDGLYMYSFDNASRIDLREEKIKNEATSNVEPIATLTYTYQGQRFHYSMKDERISISGRKDKRNARMVFKVENDNLLNDHVQIKYEKNDNEFYICAFGKTILNQRLMNLSEGGDVKWVKLADNSSIFMNDEIKVQFEKNN